MGKLSLTQFVTLDGVYQGPGGVDEDRRNGFEHGGWAFPFGDDDFGAFVDEIFGRPAAFLLGRHTYEIFASYWPKQTDPANLIASQLNALPKYVTSRTLKTADWAPTTILSGDAVQEVAALKDRVDGEIQMHGSGGLAQSLMAADLIDTLHLLVFPVVLGSGFRFFAEGAKPTAFRNVGSRTTSTGISINTYELAGRPEYGTFE